MATRSSATITTPSGACRSAASGRPRAHHARGVPVRPELADHPAEAPGVPRPRSTGSTPTSIAATPTMTWRGSWRTRASCATGPRSWPRCGTHAPPSGCGSAAASSGSSGRTGSDDTHAPRTLGRPAGPDAGITGAGRRPAQPNGFVFVGPTTAWALMQAIGLVDDHLVGCHRRGARDAGRDRAPAAREQGRSTSRDDTRRTASQRRDAPAVRLSPAWHRQVTRAWSSAGPGAPRRRAPRSRRGHPRPGRARAGSPRVTKKLSGASTTSAPAFAAASRQRQPPNR